MTTKDRGDAGVAGPGSCAGASSPLAVSPLRAAIPIADLSDEQIDGFIADPARIETHEQAIAVIDVLDHEIASIQAQVDAAAIESNIRPLSPDRQAWLRRASYAGAMRRNERHKVMQRDREIRRTKGQAQQKSRKDPAIGLAKHARLHAEAEARRISKQAEAEKHRAQIMRFSEEKRERESRQRWEHRFCEAARRLLTPDRYEEIKSAAPPPFEARRAQTIAEPSGAMMGSGVGRFLRALSDIVPDDEAVQEIRDWADFIVREIYFAMMGADGLAQGIEARRAETEGLGSREPGPAEQDAPELTPEQRQSLVTEQFRAALRHEEDQHGG